MSATFTAVIHREGKFYVAYCPEVGTASQGTTIPAAVALQLLSYHVARLRGCPIDQPRNLAKSVTVE